MLACYLTKFTVFAVGAVNLVYANIIVSQI